MTIASYASLARATGIMPSALEAAGVAPSDTPEAARDAVRAAAGPDAWRRAELARSTVAAASELVKGMNARGTRGGGARGASHTPTATHAPSFAASHRPPTLNAEQVRVREQVITNILSRGDNRKSREEIERAYDESMAASARSSAPASSSDRAHQREQVITNIFNRGDNRKTREQIAEAYDASFPKGAA